MTEEKNIKDFRIDNIIQYNNNILALWKVYRIYLKRLEKVISFQE